MHLTGTHLVGLGDSREEPPSFSGVDPRDGSPLEPGYSEASTTEIDGAFTLAERARRPLRRVSAKARAGLLEAVASAIVDIGDALLERACAETGLPIARLTAERGRTVGQLRMFARIVRDGDWLDPRIEPADPDREPLPRPDLRRTLRPLGPVVVFGASNFPLAFSVAGGDTASALAAGCPVIVKAHPNHPGTSELVGRAIRSAVSTQMPEGTFSLLHGADTVVGQLLVAHPHARAVAFTGSIRGGRALFELAASRPVPIPVYAEMGSVNPVFVLPGALAERSEEIARGLAESVCLGVGQFCTKPGLIITVEGEHTGSFVRGLTELFAAAAPGTMLHAGIARSFADAVNGLRACEGVRDLHLPPPPPAGSCQSSPTLLATAGATVLAESAVTVECFGPSALVVVCASHEEMQQVAENLGGQLTATIHAAAADASSVPGLVDILEEKAGRLLFGGFPTGVEVCSAMQHGGPYPATTDSRTTSVGADALLRFVRPVCYQGFPAELLPPELRG